MIQRLKQSGKSWITGHSKPIIFYFLFSEKKTPYIKEFSFIPVNTKE